MVTVAFLSLAVLGMTVPALPASAATGSADACEHKNSVLSSSQVIRYLNANQWTHQKLANNIYHCFDCGQSYMIENEITSEAHKQVVNTNYCACGYQLY